LEFHQGNQILDVKDIDISDPEELEILINNIAGVVDNGIFAKNKPKVVLVSE
jgi:ribose 5-phosphate isomerase A